MTPLISFVWRKFGNFWDRLRARVYITYW